MLSLKEHIGILILLIMVCNLVEVFNKDPFNNESCPNGYVPTGCAVMIFIIIEMFINVTYFFFIYKG